MKTKYHELMGKIVTVHTTTKREHVWDEAEKITNAVCVDTPIPPRAGWIVGIRHIKTGIFHPSTQSSGYFDVEPEFEQAYLEVKAVIHMYQVVFWPTMKPVHVRQENFSEGGTPINPHALAMTEFKTKYPTEYAKWVKIYSEDAKNAPRGTNGKFIKVTK